MTGTLPNELPAAANATLPAETVLPAGALTVAVRTVLAVGVIVAGLATAVSVVGCAEAVTVTTTVPLEPEIPELPEYVAVIELGPIGRFAPLTVTLAAATALEFERLAVPSVVLPAVKVTIPDGVAVPGGIFTVAVRTEEAVCRIDDGVATRASVVAAEEPVTFSTSGADDEPLKPLPPA